MTRILSVEDDPDLQHLLALGLRAEGYDLHYAFTGEEGYEKALSLNPDIVILDMMLPVYNGAELLQKLRAHKALQNVPVIVITAFGEDSRFLEADLRALGAVEYVRKPVQLEELKRVLRRYETKTRAAEAPRILQRGEVRLDPAYRAVFVRDRLVATLTQRRFELLRILVEKGGEVSREELTRAIWGEGDQARNLDKTVQRLREDLGPVESLRLQTTENGYKLAA